MSNASEAIPVSAKEAGTADDYLTYVEGVGNIPRDIYKHVVSDPAGDLPRYSPHIVIQHILVVITFVVLVLTGLPVYYSDLFWAPHLISLFGGADTARIVHRVAAFTLIFTCIYHVVTVVGGTARKILRNEFDYKRTQIPRLKDLIDLYQDLKYFVGFAPYRPKMEKFMYKQKLHYLAIIWGNTVLITAGMALLYPGLMAKVFPETLASLLPVRGEGAFPAFFQEFARLMHADEAVMALIVVSFWHLINVHFVPGRFPFQWAFLTGKITREHQIEEHFLEYIRNLNEMPEEREYMKKLLKEKGYAKSASTPVSEMPRIV
jgi:thiosulfate reductase cytochrome b subunit